jgi:hypothetical protein
MQVFSSIELAVPLWQIVFYLGLITYFMLAGKARHCLITSYAFIFYWCFIYNEELISSILGGPPFSLMVYLIAGFTFVILVILTFLATD